MNPLYFEVYGLQTHTPHRYQGPQAILPALLYAATFIVLYHEFLSHCLCEGSPERA